jgi:hypothetical protein
MFYVFFLFLADNFDRYDVHSSKVISSNDVSSNNFSSKSTKTTFRLNTFCLKTSSSNVVSSNDLLSKDLVQTYRLGQLIGLLFLVTILPLGAYLFRLGAHF